MTSKIGSHNYMLKLSGVPRLPEPMSAKGLLEKSQLKLLL